MGHDGGHPGTLRVLDGRSRGRTTTRRRASPSPCPRPSRRASRPSTRRQGQELSKEKNEEGETIYEVELTVKTNVNVNFDEKGEVEVIERTIGAFELPEVVKKVAAKAFPKGKIVRVETVVEEESELKYEVVIAIKGKKPFEV